MEGGHYRVGAGTAAKAEGTRSRLTEVGDRLRWLGSHWKDPGSKCQEESPLSARREYF